MSGEEFTIPAMTSEQLVKLRKKYWSTQEDLATEMGVERSTIAKWESGVIDIPRGRANHIRMLAEKKEAAA